MGAWNENLLSSHELRIDVRAREQERAEMLRERLDSQGPRAERLTAAAPATRLSSESIASLNRLAVSRSHFETTSQPFGPRHQLATGLRSETVLRPRSVPPQPPKAQTRAPQASSLEARLDAREFVEDQRRGAAAQAYHRAFPNDKAMPVTLEQIKAKLAKVDYATRTTFLRAIESDGLGTVRSGYRLAIEAQTPPRHSTVEAVMQKALEVNRQGRLLEALIPAGPDHEVVTAVLETARDNLRKTMSQLTFDGTDASLLPLLKALAEMQDALEITGKEHMDRDGAAMLAKYSGTLRSLRANVALMAESPAQSLKNFNDKRGATQPLSQSHIELRAAGTKLYEKLDTDSMLALGKAQAGVADAMQSSKPRLMFRLLALRDVLHSLLGNSRVPSDAKSALRAYETKLAAMIDAAR